MSVHGVRRDWWSSSPGRVLAGVGVGVLGRWVTPGLVDEVVARARAEGAAGGKVAGRRCRLLPDRLGVVFVLGLCLFSALPYRAVVKQLAAGLEGALAAAGWRVPACTALSRARARLGERPFELLVGRLCPGLGVGVAPWSHICGRLAVAWDGTTVAAWASAPNMAAFGRPGGGASKTGAYPLLRLVVLIGCGSRALAAAAAGPWRGATERALAAQLTGRLRAGMLLLADRGFYSYRLWQQAAGTGADLLWRLAGSVHLPVCQVLPDGSWLSKLPGPAQRRRRHNINYQRRRRGSPLPPQTGPLPGGITVRVLDFDLAITGSTGKPRTERYRLATTLLDPATAPAATLATGYAQRWAIETGFREFKTYLRGPGRILRGRTPTLARQELWAYLAIYQAIRTLMNTAAASQHLDPDRISFTTTLHAIRRTLPTARTHPTTAWHDTHTDILDPRERVPERPGRICVRAVNKPTAAYPSKHNTSQPHTQHATYTATITTPTQPPPTPPSQAKHHPPTTSQPP